MEGIALLAEIAVRQMESEKHAKNPTPLPSPPSSPPKKLVSQHPPPINTNADTAPNRRRRTTPKQLQRLLHVFNNVTPFPDLQTRQRMGKEIGMTRHEITVWFQNYRAKMRRVQIESKRRVLGKAKRAEGGPLSAPVRGEDGALPPLRAMFPAAVPASKVEWAPVRS
jgi:hypothetical protein